MYTGKNFKNKEDLEKAIKKGQKVTVFQPRWASKVIHQKVPNNGTIAVMGPWFRLRNLRDEKDIAPESKQHNWWADVQIKDGRIVDVY